MSTPKGIKAGDAELVTVRLRRHDFHGEWNYTIDPPRTRRKVPGAEITMV